MSLVLGKNASNELNPINLTNTGLLKIDLAGNSGGAIAADVDVTGNTIGLATDITLNSRASEATQLNVESVLQSIDSYQSTISLEVGDLNAKVSQGYDAQIASGGSGLQQTLVYGRDGSGNLDAVKVNNNGNLQVGIHDFDDVKGQATMANSLPVVIASDQSAISVTTAGANTTNVNDVLAPGAGGTATSTAIDMDGFTNLSFFGNSTNITDFIVVQVSHNNSTWVENSEAFVNFAPNGDFFVNIPNTGARYFRVQQIDTLTTAFTLTVNSSKK